MKWSQRLGDVEFKHMHSSIREHIPKPVQEESLPPPTGVEEPPSELEEVRQENENKRRRYLPG